MNPLRRRRGTHWNGESVESICSRIEVLFHARLPSGRLVLLVPPATNTQEWNGLQADGSFKIGWSQ